MTESKQNFQLVSAQWATQCVSKKLCCITKKRLNCNNQIQKKSTQINLVFRVEIRN